MSDNVGPLATVPETASEMFEAFDRLPPRFRHLLAHAPYDYSCVRLSRRYFAAREGYSEDQLIAKWLKNMVGDRQRAALSLYGPDHPQAFA